MRPGSLAAFLCLALPLALAAQSRGRPMLANENPAYDGRFTFTRARYQGPGMRGFGGSTWSHDYPDADRNMHHILEFLTTVRVHSDGTNVFTLDDPELFRHPILYLSEPGYWSASDGELASLRNYLLKGGFLIFDDFEEEQWWNMEANVKRALPERVFIEIGADHPIFRTLLKIDDIYVPHPFVAPSSLHGDLEDDNPGQRMLVLANHNSDLAEYWEWSAQGFPGGHHQRGLCARRQLPHLRADTLASPAR
jgi:hypothetical protein